MDNWGLPLSLQPPIADDFSVILQFYFIMETESIVRCFGNFNNMKGIKMKKKIIMALTVILCIVSGIVYANDCGLKVDINDDGKINLVEIIHGLQIVAGLKTNTTPSIYNAMIYSGVHDPSHLIKMDNQIMLFASAVEWSSYELNSDNWILRGDSLYDNISPSWYNGNNQFWAPSVYQSSTNQFRLYHSAVEDENNHISKIGFADVTGTAPDLSFQPSTDYVLESENENQPFAIDPAVFRDDDGRAWLVYGSHAKGIYIVELDEDSGLLKINPNNKTWEETDKRFTHIANYGGLLEENNVEAAFIYNHPENGFYYLFVNWDQCCNGINSTYNIRVGRSLSPTGPFHDKDGHDLATGGGTVFLDANGQTFGNSRFIGPGHAGIYRHADNHYYFSHHFYDNDNNGEPSLAIWKMNWESDWPSIDINFKVKL